MSHLTQQMGTSHWLLLLPTKVSITLALILAFHNGKPVIQPQLMGCSVETGHQPTTSSGVNIWLGWPALQEGDIPHGLLTKHYLNKDGEENQLQIQQIVSPCPSTVTTINLQQGGRRCTKRTNTGFTIPNETEVARCTQQSAAQLRKAKIQELPSAEKALLMKSD